LYHVIAVMIMGMILGLGGEATAEEKALRMIVVRDRKEANDIRQELRKGASFSALAHLKSIGPERRQWGYSGVVKIEDVQAELRPALQQLQLGQISDVIDVGQKYILVKVISPQLPRHLEAANEALRQGQTAQALQSLRAALRLEPDNVPTFIKLGVVYDQDGQYAAAVEHLDKAQQLAPTDAQIAILLGSVATNAVIKKGEQTYAKKALAAYRQALKLDERLAPAVHFGLGKVYLVALKQPEQALPHLEKAAAASPNVPEVYGMLIQAYYDTQRYQQAWEYLRHAQSLGFEFPQLLTALQKVKDQQPRR
jgi:tetratricopeptide (TPR) repeat protein